ncbi:hypothetical protein Tco_0757232 [Tanacetum coccineum]
MGDLNVALNMEDIYSGSSSMNSAMCDFKDCVANIEISDHSLAVLRIPNHISPKPKPFKFFNFLTSKNTFMEVVEEGWNSNVEGHNMFKVVSKLKALKKPLRKLLHDQGNIHERVNKLRHELYEVQKALDANPADSFLREEKAVYLQAFNEAKLDEDRFWKQKAKVEWLEAGDANSAYFYKSIKSRNQRCRIDVVLDNANVEVSGAHVPDVFVSHYEEFLGTFMVCDDLDVEDLFHNQVSDICASNMVRDITNEEIKTAMFDIGEDKAHGPNGSCKILVEKAKNRIGDWKNQSLSFAGRLQLAKVAWEDICLPKRERGLGLRSLDVFNIALMTTHIWNIIRDIVQPWFWIKVGNGLSTSVWYDMWCPQSPLIRFLSPRDINREGFHLQNCVADMIADGVWIWPQSWLLKAPKLGLIPVPILEHSRPDQAQLCETNSNLVEFSVSRDWEALRPRGNEPMSHKRTVQSIIGRLILAATSYVIWLERNNRLFKKVKRSPEVIRDVIIVTVRLKLLTFRFKNKVMVQQLLSQWKMPTNFRLYGY